MTQTEAYILEQPDSQRQIMQYLHDVLMSFPKITTKVKHNIPFYYRRKWMCYLNPIKGGGVELCFLRGSELSNEQGIVVANKRKMVAGISYYSADEIDKKTLNEVINEAILLDELN